MLLLSLYVCLALTSSAEALCLGVASCSCEVGTIGLIVNCRNQNLDRVPIFRSEELLYYELTLESNLITTIEENAFAGVKATRLVLTNNYLKSISDNAFAGLEMNLTDLALQLDKGTAFPTSALSKLTKLECLEIVGYSYDSLPPNALASLLNLRKLTLKSGTLRILSVVDLTSQTSQLTYLNLHSNMLPAVPTSALTPMSNLSELYLDLNQITKIGSGAFDGVSNLKVLDLSRNPINILELDSFSGLENTLSNISLQKCHLSNDHLKAVIPLRSLVYLDISDNLLDQIDDILANMKLLQVLMASRNRISSLKRATYRSMSTSLNIIHLDDNPLNDVAADTFVELKNLRELYLDGAQRLALDADSFVSQNTSMHLLSLRSSILPVSPWPAISRLTSLRTLWASSCGMTDIPDLAFSRTSQLENLDLNNNAISSITQRSLSGLENSLVRLYLSGNTMTTLDECVFYKFKKLDVLQLQLNNNPLECNCELKWLHDLLTPYKSNPNTQFRVRTLQWKCANLNEKLFTTLTDDNFVCNKTSETSSRCEELEADTSTTRFADFSTPTSGPTSSYLTVKIAGVTHDSILITWITHQSGVKEFILTYIVDGHVRRILSLDSEMNQYQLIGLTPSTHYIVCIEMVTVSTSMTSCTNTSTEAGPESSMFPVILGASVAAGFVFVCLVVAIVVCFVCRRQQTKSSPELVRQPTVGRQSKRYRKTRDLDATVASDPEVDTFEQDTLVHTLVRMTDEEKDRLVNLLTSSRGSLDDLDRKSSCRYVGAHYGRIDRNPYLYPAGYRDRHEYDEIPDSYYDEIKDAEEGDKQMEDEVSGREAAGGDREGEGKTMAASEVRLHSAIDQETTGLFKSRTSN